jgi:hypothetical protein
MEAPPMTDGNTLEGFRERAAALYNLERKDIPGISNHGWETFRNNPLRYFLIAGETRYAAIWREVEKRVVGKG